MLALQRRPPKKPPFLWPIQVQRQEPEFLKTPAFYKAARAMRTRVESRIMRLDMDKTVSRTIKKLSFPDFVYRPLTRPPEYLVLIDLPEHGDMYSNYLDTLTDVLKAEGIHVERFFYRRDPQVCFSSPGGAGYELSELQSRFREHRLILAGDAEALFDPVTGSLVPWIELFRASWSDRAILTPKHPDLWGMKEVKLAREFIVLPATTQGLAQLIAHYEDPSIQDLKSWSPQEDPQPCEPEAQQIDALSDYLGKSVFQWLCACAVYPELNWSLMLSLSRFTDEPLTEETLLKLVRLPWFRRGAIPDEIRLKLIGQLEPERLKAIRQEICSILENNEPPKESEAWDTYQLNLAVHKWMVSPKRRKQLKAIQKDVQNLDENTIVQDYTLLQILEQTELSPFALVLPKNLQRRFYNHGLTALGLKTSIQTVLTLIFCALLFLVIPTPRTIDITDITDTKTPKHGDKLTNKLDMTFVYIKPGTFKMGSPESEPERLIDETLHNVELTKGFYMQTTEVTVGQWRQFVKETGYKTEAETGDGCYTWKGSSWEKVKGAYWDKPGFKQTGSNPVTCVSWNDVQKFIAWLNKKGEGSYSLPTEAQWEYAARAGTTTPFAFGNCLSTDDANYDGNYPLKGCKKGEYRQKTISVGSLKANEWGLYDMHGNVWEWCQDWYGDYPTGVVDPTGPSTGAHRVLRGGSWADYARRCRSAYRVRDASDNRFDYAGFRLVLPLGQR